MKMSWYCSAFVYALIIIADYQVDGLQVSSNLLKYGWQCGQSECSKCVLFSPGGGDTLVPDCFQDIGLYESELDCQLKTSCGPIRWTCSEDDRSCNWCNSAQGSERPCNTQSKQFKTEIECELGAKKCTPKCSKPDESYVKCPLCEPSCSQMQLFSEFDGKCETFGCNPDCACNPGYFRSDTGCVRPEMCPRLEGKACFNALLSYFEKNIGKINASEWPLLKSSDQPQCEVQGHFKMVQCIGDQCFCVDSLTGIRTDVPLITNNGRVPECTKAEARKPKFYDSSPTKSLTKCQELSFAAVSMHDDGNTEGPVCDSNGRFMPLQCSRRTNDCWCVDPDTGLEQGQTRHGTQRGSVFCMSSRKLSNGGLPGGIFQNIKGWRRVRMR